MERRSQMASQSLMEDGAALSVCGPALIRRKVSPAAHILRLLFVFGFIALGIACETLPYAHPPRFHYDPLAAQYFRKKPQSHFLITTQREDNLDPHVAAKRFLFYTGYAEGSGDIWMRDLRNTTSIAVIHHPAEQYQATANATGALLAFVSEDKDVEGDLRLLAFRPEVLSANSLRGFSPPQLWSSTVLLSAQIERWAARNLPPACHGTSSEREPHLNLSGELLLFASDRCNRGSFFIWLAKLKGTKLLSLGRLSKQGGHSPRFSPDSSKVVFLSYADNTKQARIYLLDRNKENSAAIELALPKKDEVQAKFLPRKKVKSGQHFFYAKPMFIEGDEGIALAYISIREDSDQNGSINEEDHGAIYSIELEGESKDWAYTPQRARIWAAKERQLLEASSQLRSLAYAPSFLESGGALFYGARLQKSSKVYFLPAYGIIPKEADIEKQYRLAENYLPNATQSGKRYLLALESIAYFFRESPAFPIYEARILKKALSYYRLRKDRQSILQIEERIRKNTLQKPYLHCLYKEGKVRKAQNSLLTYVPACKEKLLQGKNTYTAGERRQIMAALEHSLARFFLEKMDLAKALEHAALLNEKYADYYLRDDALFLEMEILLKQGKSLVKSIKALLKARGPVSTQEEASLWERIHKMLYHYSRHTKIPALKKERLQEERKLFAQAADTEAKKENFPAEALAKSVDIALAQALLKEAKYQEALELALFVQREIPKDKSLFRFVPKAAWRTLYTHAWLIIADSYKALAKPQEYFLALGEIASTYDQASGIEPDPEGFKELIDHTYKEIISYRKAARSLSKSYKIWPEPQKRSRRRLYSKQKGKLAQSFRSPGYSWQIPKKDLETLFVLCKSSPSMNPVFQSLASKSARAYVEFCNTNRARLQALLGNGAASQKQREKRKNMRKPIIPKEEVRKAIALFYSLSYANARNLNLLFFNIGRLEALQKLYAERSIYFQRLEVDIVVEQNQQSLELSGLKSKLVLKLILGDREVYNLENFRALERDYQLILKRAVSANNLSTLYGYAYALTQKNLERERLYQRLQEKGSHLSEQFLQKAKKEILQDLKNAEYLLQYILHVDPSHTDAYLLLGWLYQYVDERKKFLVQYKRNLIASLIQSANKEEDGRFYEHFYEVYFPDQYYEANTELYQRALNYVSRKEEQQGKEKQEYAFHLGRLHLNLANNYFILLNFREAAKHYEQSLSYLDPAKPGAGRQRDGFESPKQRALTYLNFGRSLLYQAASKPEYYPKSIFYLKKCYDFYEKEEYAPLQREYKRARFFISEEYEKNKPLPAESAEDLEKAMENSRARMALLLALIGLAYWQSGQSQAAVPYYEKADHYLSKKGKALRSGLNRANLLNFLAMAYQDNKQLEKSDKKAKLAGFYAKKEELHRDDSLYQPKTYCGRGLGCLLDFGEDFSVIGKGRNPYGFSSLRQYQLSLGIQLENMLIRGELAKAELLLKEQREILAAHDLDLKHGQRAYLNNLNREALHFYKRQDYKQAAQLFQKAAKKAKELKDIVSYERNFANALKAILGLLQYHPYQKEENIIELTDAALEELEAFEKDFRSWLLKKFIQKRRFEYAAYEFHRAKDGVAFENMARRRLHRIASLRSHLFFYKGLSLLAAASRGREKQGQKQHKEAHSYFARAINITKTIIADKDEESKEASEQRFLVRCRYNLARLYWISGRLELAHSLIQSALREALEFHLIREEMLLRLLDIRLLEEVQSLAPSAEKQKQSAYHSQRLLSLIYEHPYYYEEWRADQEHIRNSFIAFLLRQKDKQKEALRLLERMKELAWQHHYFRYPITQNESRSQKIYEQVRENFVELRSLEQLERRKRFRREKLSDIFLQRKALRKDTKQKLAQLRLLVPEHRSFLQDLFGPSKDRQAALDGRQKLIVLFQIDARSAASWCFTGKAISKAGLIFALEQSQRGQKKQALAKKMLEQCIGQDRQIEDIFIISDAAFFGVDFHAITAQIDEALPAPVFASSLSEIFLGYGSSQKRIIQNKHLNTVNIGPPKTRLLEGKEQAFILSLQSEEKPNITTVTQALRFKLTGKNTHAIALLHLPAGDSAFNLPKGLSYQKLLLLYECLRSQGIASLLLAERSKAPSLLSILSIAGTQAYASKGLRLFGFPGFAGKEYGKYSKEQYEAHRKQAQTWAQQGLLQKAQLYYQKAASYVPWHPEAEEIEAELALEWTQIEILLAYAPQNFHALQGKAEQQLLAKQASLLQDIAALLLYAQNKKKRDFESRIYQQSVASFLQNQKYSLAQRYLSAYSKRFPKKQELYEQDAWLSLIQALGAKEKSGAQEDDHKRIERLWRKALPYLTRQGPAQIIETLALLAAKLQYDMAEELLRQYEAKQEAEQSPEYLRQTLRDWEAAIALDKYFLAQAPLSPSLDKLFSSKQRDPFLRLLWALWSGKKEENLGLRKASAAAALGKIVHEWSKALKGVPIKLQNLEYVIDTRDTSKAQGLSEAKRGYVLLFQDSLLYHLLLKYAHLDSSASHVYLLEQFLSSKHRTLPPSRKAAMLLGIAERYAQENAFMQALYFFQLYREMRGAAIYQAKQSNRAARLAMVLDALGKDKFQDFYALWLQKPQAQEEEGLPKTLFVELWLSLKQENLLLKKLDPALALFLQKASDPALYRDIAMALGFLQWKAEKNENWQALANLAFLKEEAALCYAAASFHLGPCKKTLSYQNYAKAIHKKIPDKQTLIALVDRGEKAWRLLFDSKTLSAVPLEESALYLRRKLCKYLQLRRLHHPEAAALGEQIKEIYSALLPPNAKALTYVWLPSVHSLAPLSSDSPAGLLQVLSLGSFLEQDLLDSAYTKAKQSFHPRVVGSRQLTQAKEGLEGDVIERIYAMEKRALAKALAHETASELGPASKLPVYHILSAIKKNNVALFAGKLRQKIAKKTAVYFLSSNLLGASLKEYGQTKPLPQIICFIV